MQDLESTFVVLMTEDQKSEAIALALESAKKHIKALKDRETILVAYMQEIYALSISSQERNSQYELTNIRADINNTSYMALLSLGIETRGE